MSSQGTKYYASTGRVRSAPSLSPPPWLCFTSTRCIFPLASVRATSLLHRPHQ